MLLTTDRPAATVLQPGSLAGPLSGVAGADAWAAASASCPEDCHYCTGPETD
ncbi:hypothetical protein [Arthrobacter sp. PM3]|uniref:hypothetical protein n=1 Tax=Arthrobacter sp. PM3 TaxID=2017685 RepID=UPI001ABFA561|nr:hypothetical protein [Arthrobacter sp. PM3]